MKWFDFLRRSKPAPATPLADIRRSFNDAAADEEHFPSTIDPRIFHVQLILRFFGDLGDGRVLDSGCGKGRFARIVKENNPQSRVTAFDLAEAMLRVVPSRNCALLWLDDLASLPRWLLRRGLCD